MTIMQTIDAETIDVVSVLITGLESEFGPGAGKALADRLLAAEEADFHWEARLEERFLGAYESLDDDDFELDRVAIVGRLDGAWFTGICIVDGEGRVHGMIWRRSFGSSDLARQVWRDAR